MSPSISDVILVPASRDELGTGLLGWVSFDLEGVLRVDGVALRRRLDGRLTLAFPSRKGRAGDSHPYLRPLDAQARSDLERQVFAALGLQGDVA